MTLDERLLLALAAVRPLLPYLCISVLITTAVTVVLLRTARHTWVTKRGFQWISLFFGLTAQDACRLSGSWLKLLNLIMLLIGFQKLGPMHYLLVLIPGLCYAFSSRNLARIPGRLVWLALEMMALLSCNLICGYILDLSPDLIFTGIYIIMAIFTTLFGIYLFFTEVNDISAGRSTNLGHEWRPESDDSDPS